MNATFPGLHCGAAVCAALVLWPATGHAWGNEGHEVVALIAEHELEPAVRNKVFAMLARDTSTLVAHDIASEATWADRFRDSDRDTTRVNYEHTSKWHFVDIDRSAPDIDEACSQHPGLPQGTAASDGPSVDCVVDKIDQFSAELKAPGTRAAERLLALKYLLHFLGDLHQPLHAINDHDSGGNTKQAKTATGPLQSLHHYWDDEFVKHLGPDPETIAAKLVGTLDTGERQAWTQGTTTDWAQDTFTVARDTAYGRLPKPRHGVYRLSAAYDRAATAAVATQLEKAGVRLAATLNRALSP